MIKFIKISFLSILLIFTLIFNVFATERKEVYEFVPSSPSNETINENGRPNNIWTWISDELCIQDTGSEKSMRRERIQDKYDRGLLTPWSEKVNGERKIKKRDTYNGKWSQSEDGVWSFVFDDSTIPVDLTKIDGVLYAFNGYGELREGIIYYGKQKNPYDTEGCLVTGVDGVVNCNEPEFLEYLKTQYLPECTSTK